eukprot:1897836-Prymnesium_polylepis.1
MFAPPVVTMWPCVVCGRMFIGSFFALNLFVGVVVDNFNRIRAEQDGSATMTSEQQQWVDTMQALMNQKAK